MGPEARFSKEIRDIFTQDDRCKHIYLIVDAHRSGKKPYDFYMLWRGEFVAIELKVVPKTRTSLSMSVLTEHQVDSLIEVEDGGCVGLFIIEFKKQQRVIMLTPGDVLNLKSLNKKSITLGDIVSNNMLSGYVAKDIKKQYINEIKKIIDSHIVMQRP